MGYKDVSSRMKVPLVGDVEQKKIVLTKLSRRTKLLAYGFAPRPTRLDFSELSSGGTDSPQDQISPPAQKVSSSNRQSKGPAPPIPHQRHDHGHRHHHASEVVSFSSGGSATAPQPAPRSSTTASTTTVSISGFSDANNSA